MPGCLSKGIVLVPGVPEVYQAPGPDKILDHLHTKDKWYSSKVPLLSKIFVLAAFFPCPEAKLDNSNQPLQSQDNQHEETGCILKFSNPQSCRSQEVHFYISPLHLSKQAISPVDLPGNPPECALYQRYLWADPHIHLCRVNSLFSKGCILSSRFLASGRLFLLPGCGRS